MPIPATATSTRPAAPPDVPPHRPEPRSGLRRTAFTVGAAVAVGVLAFAIRLGVLLHGGGLAGIGGYDDGVYFAAGDALVHGRLPYARFLFLHPPGIVLATAPFAALGSVVGDRTAFEIARVAFELIGAANAVLVVLVLRRFGRVAPLVGGVLYAVLLPAVWAERSVLLEPLGTLGVLLALLLLGRGRTGWRVVAAGVAAGLAADVKIWYVVPVLVIAVAGTRHPIRFLLAAGAAVAAVWVPFLVAAPTAMVREVVLDQLGRPKVGGLQTRLQGMLDVGLLHGLDLRTATSVLVLLAAVALCLTLLTRGARVLGLLLAADAAVLLAAPTWFEHYGAFTAPPLALCVGVAAQRIAGVLPAGRWTRPAFAILLTAVVLVQGLQVVDRSRSGVVVPTAFTAAMARTRGCITSDDPTILIVGDVLSRDLSEARCSVWPDVTGWTYDRAKQTLPYGHAAPRTANAGWQRLLLHHLRSGAATVVVRHSIGLSARSRAVLRREPVLFRDGRFVLRAVHHHEQRTAHRVARRA